MADLHTPILQRLFRKRLEEESPGEGVVDRIEGDVAVLDIPGVGERHVPAQSLVEGQEIDPLTRAAADLPDQAPEREGIKVLDSPAFREAVAGDEQAGSAARTGPAEVVKAPTGETVRAIKTYTGPEAPETEPTMAEARQTAASKATFDWDAPQAWGGGGGYNFEYTPSEEGPGTITVTRPGDEGFTPRTYSSDSPVYEAIMGEFFRGDVGAVHEAPKYAPEKPVEARPGDVGESTMDPDTRTSEHPDEGPDFVSEYLESAPDEERDLVGESIAQLQPPESLPWTIADVRREASARQREIPSRIASGINAAFKAQESPRGDSPRGGVGWQPPEGKVWSEEQMRWIEADSPSQTQRLTQRAADRARAAKVAAASEADTGESPQEFESPMPDTRESRLAQESPQEFESPQPPKVKAPDQRAYREPAPSPKSVVDALLDSGLALEDLLDALDVGQ